MKKIFRVRNKEGYYEPFYGENLEALDNNSLLPTGYEYEMEFETPLELLWMTFSDHGAIPRDLVTINKIETHGDYIKGKIIGNKVKLWKLREQETEKSFEMDLENLKQIWKKYNELESQNADEIILERDGDHFSIRGIWFDKEQNTKTDK